MSEFGEVSMCLVGIGEIGESLLSEGFEDRGSDAAMVPNSEIEAVTKHVESGGSGETTGVGLFDLVAVTGEISDDDAVKTAVQVGDACDSKAISVAVLTSKPAVSELQRLNQAFGTVIVVETEQWIQELLTDLFTLFSQPMMLHTDVAQINSNLKQKSMATVCRTTGQRGALQNVVASCSGAGDVLVGYAAVGSEFTVGDAEMLEELLEDPQLVGGQATLPDDTGIRLTVLRKATSQ